MLWCNGYHERFGAPGLAINPRSAPAGGNQCKVNFSLIQRAYHVFGRIFPHSQPDLRDLSLRFLQDIPQDIRRNCGYDFDRGSDEQDAPDPEHRKCSLSRSSPVYGAGVPPETLSFLSGRLSEGRCLRRPPWSLKICVDRRANTDCLRPSGG